MEMIDKQHIELLSGKLKEVLSLELRNGNAIVETWSGWPSAQSIGIMVEKPFTVDVDGYNLGVEYRVVNDPYYWQAEYVDNEKSHYLVCRF